jgi:diguanylate cyclase (GGDEF)-like protein
MKGAFKAGKMKYTILISFITAAVISVCIVYIFGLQHILEGDNRTFFTEIASESAKTLESKLDSRLSALSDYAHHFIDFQSAPRGERQEIVASVMRSGTFDDLIYIEMNGTAISARHGNGMLSHRGFFRLASSGIKNVSEVLTSDFSGESIHVFSVPVYDNGVITAVLSGAMNVDYINDLMSTDTFNGKAISYVMNSDGVIVLTPPGDILYVDSGMSLFEAITLTNITEAELKGEFIKDQAHGSFVFDVEGEPFFASFKAIGINDWIVMNIVHSNDIRAVTGNVLSMALIFTALFAAFVCAGIIFFGIRSWLASKKYHEAVSERDVLKYIDSLTGGPSFEKFMEVVEELFAKKVNTNYAMLSMDISKFRTINDHLGHDEGNKVLVKLAELLERNIVAGETYTRRSADKFYILIKYDADVDIFGRIDTIINDAYYQVGDMKLTLLFGVYKIDDLDMDVRHILDRADLARRTIKSNNESSFAFFDNNMLTKIREEKQIESLMESALESREFRVYLQPKYDLHDRTTIIGAEALVRWFRDGKMIPPGGFIPIFEKNGFILKVDRFVFEEVCKQQKIWLARGYEMRVISVNMSRVNLQEPNFVRDLYDICTKYNVPTKYFEIEITESVAFENLDVLTRVFNELKNYGFHISIDDFGTGYSSLNMLKNLPVDVLKIDRAFLTDTGKNERANNIISHVIQLALSLHMKTICEGIETIEQVSLLSELGCDMAQGFYFARPMPIEDYEKLLYSDNKEPVTN